MASGTVTSSQLAFALDMAVQDIENALNELTSYYEQNARGLRLQRHHGRFQLTTAPELAPIVERFLNLDTTSRLSRAALETLAIIAYKEPITRPQIDGIRGVNSDGVLKSLLSKGLIQEVGRAEAPGRPILYNVTSDFLSYFGLDSLNQLPPLKIDNSDSAVVPTEDNTNLLTV